MKERTSFERDRRGQNPSQKRGIPLKKWLNQLIKISLLRLEEDRPERENEKRNEITRLFRRGMLLLNL